MTEDHAANADQDHQQNEAVQAEEAKECVRENTSCDGALERVKMVDSDLLSNESIMLTPVEEETIEQVQEMEESDGNEDVQKPEEDNHAELKNDEIRDDTDGDDKALVSENNNQEEMKGQDEETNEESSVSLQEDVQVPISVSEVALVSDDNQAEAASVLGFTTPQKPSEEQPNELEAAPSVLDDSEKQDSVAVDSHRAPSDDGSQPILAKKFVKTPFKAPKDKLSFTSRELQEIQARRAELEAERVRNEKFRILAQKPVHPMVERSVKPLTLPVTPELQSTKRGTFRCVGHAVAVGNPCTPECQRKFITAEELVARPDHVTEPPPPSKPLRPTVAHSPSFGRALRAHSQEPVMVGPVLAENLVFRKAKPASPVRKLKRQTVAESPALMTKMRANKKQKVEDKENVNPETGYLTAEALVARPLISKKTFGPQTEKQSTKKATLPLMPQLQTMERANFQTKYRKPVAFDDVDAIEMTKQFVANPVPTTTFKAQKLKRPAAPAPVQAVTPPLESIKRHAHYKESFEARRKRELEEEEAKRVFKANPMPVGSGFAPSMKHKTPLTVPQPFQCPGDVYHERHVEKMKELRTREEEALRKQAQVKATPMPIADQVIPLQPSTKPLTQAKSPMLALKRRMVDRAAFDRKEQERRQKEEEIRLQLAKEAERKEQLEIKAWRRNELTFHALKRRKARGKSESM